MNMENDQITNEKHRSITKLIKKEWHELSVLEKKIVDAVVHRKIVATEAKMTDDDRTFGERIADKVASVGGSWTFIISFGVVLLFWVFLNSLILARYQDDFDPYPYILLNLFLSMLASIQAPIIMMSQNRQAIKDRQDAAHDYEINLKAEIEILSIHEKLDNLREQKWVELISLQQKQIELLDELLRRKS